MAKVSKNRNRDKFYIDLQGRALPFLAPSFSNNRDGDITNMSKGEEYIINAVRAWVQSENNPDLRARLWAWEDIENSLHLFMMGEETRADDIKNAPVSPEDAAALDAIIKMWDRKTTRYRKLFKLWAKKDKAQKKAAKALGTLEVVKQEVQDV